MTKRRRRMFSAAESAEAWDRWQRGDGLKLIGRVFDRTSSSIFAHLKPHGGIRPVPRRRSRRVPSLGSCLATQAVQAVWRERKAREYRLTFVNTTDAIGRMIKATNDYLKFDTTDVVAAKAKSATAFVAAKLDSATASVAGTNGKLPKTENRPATNGVVPIIKPYADMRSEAGEPLNSDPNSASGPIANEAA